MIALIFSIFFTTKLHAIDLKLGEYELISGNEAICEDGLLIVKNQDLHLGSRYIFPHFKQSTYEFKSDDRSCDYKLINSHLEKTYKQIFEQNCKNKNENFKREMEFSYNSPTELQIKIQKDKNIETCLLKLIK